MAAKLTFETKMEGVEKLIDLLTKAEQKVNGLGETGDLAFQKMGDSFKQFEESFKFINDTKSSFGGLMSSFSQISNDANKLLQDFQTKAVKSHKDSLKELQGSLKEMRSEIGQAERDLARLEQTKHTKSTEDYLATKQMMTSRLQELQGKFLTGAATEAEQSRLQWAQSRFFGGAGDYMAARGGILGNIFGATNAQMAANFPGMIQAGAATIGMVRQGIQLSGNIGRAEVYDRSLQPIYQYLAQRQAEQLTGEAAYGDPTSAILRRYGIGVEAKEQGSEATKRAAESDALLSSRGMGGTFGAGIGAVGALALGALLAPVTGGTSLLAAGALATTGAAAGGLTGYYTANPITEEQAMSKYRMQYAQLDKETYGLTLNPAMQKFREESQLTKLQQRMFGVGTSHENTSELMRQGIADLKDLAGFINELNKFGKTLKNAEVGVFGERFGMSSSAARSAFARSVAARGETAAMSNAMDLAARAGFYGKETIPGREVLSDYAAQIANQRGFGATDINQTGALAASIAAGGNLPPSVAAETGVGVANRIKEMQSTTGTFTNVMTRAALTKLGIVNPILQSLLIKQGLDQQDTKEKIFAIAQRHGISRDKAAQILSQAGVTITRAFEKVSGFTPGSDAYEDARLAGMDPTTGLLTGNVKLAEQMYSQGKTMIDAFGTSFQDQPGTNIPMALRRQIPETGKGQMDIESGMEAQKAARLEDSIKTIADSAGTTVAQVLQQAVADGFRNMAEQISGAQKKINEQVPIRTEFTEGMLKGIPGVDKTVTGPPNKK